MLDGRIARFTRTGSQFGAELDSLVDAISFGVAPGYIMYQLYFSDTQWSWTLSYVYITAVVVRLARFNIEQGGEAKRYFHGLPVPRGGDAAGVVLPVQPDALLPAYLADLPWPQITGVSVVLLGVLLVSHIPYAKVPRIGLRTRPWARSPPPSCWRASSRRYRSRSTSSSPSSSCTSCGGW